MGHGDREVRRAPGLLGLGAMVCVSVLAALAVPGSSGALAASWSRVGGDETRQSWNLVITNESDQPLLIRSLSANCTCVLTQGLTERSVPPYGQQTVRVTITAASRTPTSGLVVHSSSALAPVVTISVPE